MKIRLKIVAHGGWKWQASCDAVPAAIGRGRTEREALGDLLFNGVRELGLGGIEFDGKPPRPSRIDQPAQGGLFPLRSGK